MNSTQRPVVPRPEELWLRGLIMLVLVLLVNLAQAVPGHLRNPQVPLDAVRGGAKGGHRPVHSGPRALAGGDGPLAQRRVC